MVAEGLPLGVPDAHGVLVLEESRALRELVVDAVPGAAPLPAHLPHGVLDQRRLGERVAVAYGEKRTLHCLVHEPPRPHLTGPELLEHVEAAHEGIRVGLPAAPGAVVMVEVAPPAVLEDVVSSAGPGEVVDEVGHGPSLSGRRTDGDALTDERPPPRLRARVAARTRDQGQPEV